MSITQLVCDDSVMQRESNREGLAQRLLRRLGARDDRTQPAPPSRSGASDRLAELKRLRQAIEQTKREIASVDQEREGLKTERLRLQEQLGAEHGKRVLPRLKVEKTNGVPSLVAGVRMMQRVHSRAPDPAAGIDGAGAMFADAEQTEAFVRSHGVRMAIDLSADPTVIVHAFQGRTPLTEVHVGDCVKHVAAGGNDLGDIRPGASYGSAIELPVWFRDIVRVSQLLSAHVSRPYVQIGWCDRNGEPVVTGLDVNPVRVPVLTKEWDQRIGKAFDSGHARMLMQPYRAGALLNRIPGGTFHYEETT